MSLSVISTVAVALLAFVSVLGGVVAVNVLYQLLIPTDPSKPPVVFHYVPIIGCAVSYGMDPYKFLFEAREKYGSVFTFPLIGRNVTAALGPLGSNFVLNGKLAHVNAEEAYTHLTTPVFGTEVVYDVPNAVLMEQKKFVKVGLTTENFRRYVGLIVGEVEEYLKETVFEKNAKITACVDAFTTSSEITICTASATLQGKEVREALDKSFAELYHDLDGGFTPLNFVFPHLPLPSYWKRDAAQVKMREFYISILERRRKSTDEPDQDMLTALQNQQYKSGEMLTDKQIAHIMIALLMAGQHTSAATGSWAILHLAERKDVQEALFKEQQEHYTAPDGSLLPITYESLANTPVLNSVIKEILRVHPPIHSIMRKVISDCPVPVTLASPSTYPALSAGEAKRREGLTYVVPKGNFVLAAPGVSQIDSAIWGNDAGEFNPARWLDGGAGTNEQEDDEGEEDFGWGKISKGGKSAYLPFGAGRHRCIGEQFANVQLGTIIATLIRQATWTLDATFPGHDYTTMIVMPLKPRNVTFTRRGTA